MRKLLLLLVLLSPAWAETPRQMIDAIMAENQGDIRAFTQAGLPELERVARESRAAATEIQDLVRSLRDNPSRLIYQPRDGGVEIPQ